MPLDAEVDDRTQELGNRLTRLAEEIPGVMNPQGSIYPRQRQTRVLFHHNSSAEPTHTYFMEYDPNSQILRAMAFGLDYSLPTGVKEHLDGRFPNSVYRLGYAPGIDGVHNWLSVQESDLP